MSVTQQFADALTELERTRDLEVLVSLFHPDAELARPEPGGHEHGAEGARRFWQLYLDQFDRIRSTFERVDESGHLGELEWVSEGRLASGRDVSYAGVSLLVVQEGQVRRFVTYYDTAALVLRP